MSDTPSSGSSPWEPIIFTIAVIGVLVALIWVRGGLSQLNTDGFFINPTTPLIEQPQNVPQQTITDTATT